MGDQLGGDGGLNLPFEDVPGGPFPVNVAGVICGGLSYRAGMMPSPVTGELMAVLVLDFHTADGGMLSPIMLVMEDDELKRLPEEIRKAVDASRRGVRQMKGRG